MLTRSTVCMLSGKFTPLLFCLFVCLIVKIVINKSNNWQIMFVIIIWLWNNLLFHLQFLSVCQHLNKKKNKNPIAFEFDDRFMFLNGHLWCVFSSLFFQNRLKIYICMLRHVLRNYPRNESMQASQYADTVKCLIRRLLNII